MLGSLVFKSPEGTREGSKGFEKARFSIQKGPVPFPNRSGSSLDPRTLGPADWKLLVLIRQPGGFEGLALGGEGAMPSRSASVTKAIGGV
jgi:hypothetical protein